jgi:hypothetical protein
LDEKNKSKNFEIPPFSPLDVKKGTGNNHIKMLFFSERFFLINSFKKKPSSKSDEQ